jgi:hypothetical protein
MNAKSPLAVAAEMQECLIGSGENEVQNGGARCLRQERFPRPKSIPKA